MSVTTTEVMHTQNKSPVVSMNRPAQKLPNSIKGKFQNFRVTTSQRVKSFFSEASKGVGLYVTNLLEVPWSVVKTAGRYAQSASNGALFGCGGGTLAGATSGALLGYCLGSVGTPLLGIPVSAVGMVIGAGVGALSGSSIGSLANILAQYRSEWIVENKALKDQLIQLKAGQAAMERQLKASQVLTSSTTT